MISPYYFTWPSPYVLCVGLDATVTLRIMQALRHRCSDTGAGAIIALLQVRLYIFLHSRSTSNLDCFVAHKYNEFTFTPLKPTPETVALFDDIMILREGAMIYHGPLVELPSYLRGIGFMPPDLISHHASQEAGDSTSSPTRLPHDTSRAVSADDDLDLADWLTEWATFPARRHRKDLARLGQSTSTGSAAPVTTAELVAAWTKHPLYTTMLASGETPASGGEALPSIELVTEAARAQYGKPYVHSAAWHLGLLFWRQVMLNRRNRLVVGV